MQDWKNKNPVSRRNRVSKFGAAHKKTGLMTGNWCRDRRCANPLGQKDVYKGGNPKIMMRVTNPPRMPKINQRFWSRFFFSAIIPQAAPNINHVINIINSIGANSAFFLLHLFIGMRICNYAGICKIYILFLSYKILITS